MPVLTLWAETESRKHLENAMTRRRFAEVGDAVVQVLAEASGELRMVEIHAAVEELLGKPVSRSSVKNYLTKGAQRRRPVLERAVAGDISSCADPG